MVQSAGFPCFVKLISGEDPSGHLMRLGVAQRDGAAVGVYFGVGFLNAEFTEDGEALGGEGFVKLNHIQVINRPANALQ